MNKLIIRHKRAYFVILTFIALTLGELAYTASSQTGLLLAAPVLNCPGGNQIVCENSLPGNPSSEWDISGVGDTSIQGFATEISVNLGEIVRFKIDTSSTDYRLDIYRMGYYGGDGARKVATVEPTATLPQDQPLCLTDSTGLIDCGNWAESASWTVPADATSGIFFAKAIREDGSNTGASHIVFVVRDDTSTSDLLFQTSDTTWQAYNDYGGNNLYGGNGPGTGLSGGGRAYKLSYNRPFFTRNVDGGEDWVFNAEYPMVRWLEANGYDMSYITGVDTDRSGNLINNHNVFLSVAHDEYWSGDQRTNVETARDAGVHLAFFSGNEVFWKIRWENSIDASGTAYRTLVCYKETHEGAKIDPTNIWTGTWRDPRFSPPADGGRPENELTGVIFGVNGGSPASTGSIKVPEADGKMRFWRNTSVATLAQGTEATLPFGTLGYEWDEVFDNGFRPFGLISLSSTTVENAPVLVDFGSTFESATATHSLTLYRDSTAGSIVFGAGTIQWSWGLDSNHDRGNAPSSPDMQQATVNLFADMGVQPDTLQSGLQAATQSTDSTAPISTIAVPADGSTVALASPITISGTATDVAGQVGGIEVSVDGGSTWSAATGRTSWSYNWTAPNSPATVAIMTRATDDSLNIESPGAVSTVLVTSGTDTTPPTVIAQSPIDGSAVIGLNAIVTSTFSEAMAATSINSLTFQLQNGNTLVSATVSYTDNTATLTPNASLSENTTYTVIVKGGAGGVEDLSGNLLAPDVTWQFTTGTVGSPNCGTGTSTIWPATITPTVTADPDTTAVELGVKFTADTNGFICGIRFFKGITNTGTHVGNLWSISGSLLATATFTNETNSGWQQVSFANPVAITANTTYVASYHAPVGQYSLDAGYFNGFQQDNPPLHALEDVASGGNGVFLTGLSGFPVNTFASSNYWVDVVYTANTIGDAVPPVVTSVTPADNSTGISPAITVTSIFNEALDPATVDATTFELRDPNNTLVPATVSYTGVIVTLIPNAVLVPNTIYTATVKGGASGVRDLAGNQLESDQSWQFTTATLGSAECIIGISTIWPETAIPAVTSDPDTSAIEIGVKFNSETDGFICGIRFYKGAANTGTHVGNLWGSDGTLLATATFINETGSGWQKVSFASPVAITANTTYIASYHAPVGRYSVNEGYFSGFEQVNLPLKALEDVASAGNGLFLPGPGGFPTNTFMSSNYWVDVVFTANTVSGTTPPTAVAGPDQTLIDSDNNGAEVVQLNGSASSDSDGTIVSYSWSSDTGVVIPNGMNTSASFPVGVHTVSLVVTDNDGKTATDNVLITIDAALNSLPIITNPGTQLNTVGEVVDLTISASDINVGDILSFSASNLPAGLSINSATGQIVGTPTAVGIDNVIISVSDGNGGSSSINFQWTVIDAVELCTTYTSSDIPVGLPNQTASISSNLLINNSASIADIDVSIDMNHQWVGDLTMSLTHTESNTKVTLIDRPGVPATNWGCRNDDLLVTLDDEGTGSLENVCATTAPTINGIYTPTEALSQFNGEAANGTWVLTVTDAYVNSDEGTLNSWELRVCESGVGQNQSPSSVAGADQTLTDTDNNGAEIVQLDGSASSDSDGTIASYSWSSDTGVVIPDGVNASASFPVGIHIVSLVVTDNDGATATDNVLITVGAVINSPPIITSPGAQLNTVGVAIDLFISAIDIDVGDVLSFNATNLPVGLSINAGTGQIVGTLVEIGVYNVIISVSDGNGGNSNINFQWTVVDVVELCTTYTSSNIPVGLPNQTASISSNLLINNSSIITDIDVSVDMDHNWVGDLTISLTHTETNTTVTLIDRPGVPATTWGCRNDDLLVTLDDDGTGSLEGICATATPTINGTYTPTAALSQFNGEAANGTWVLTVADAYVSSDSGTLNSWEIQVCTGGGN